MFTRHMMSFFLFWVISSRILCTTRKSNKPDRKTPTELCLICLEKGSLKVQSRLEPRKIWARLRGHNSADTLVLVAWLNPGIERKSWGEGRYWLPRERLSICDVCSPHIRTVHTMLVGIRLQRRNSRGFFPSAIAQPMETEKIHKLLIIHSCVKFAFLNK